MPTIVTWTVDEDHRLKQLVDQFGQKRWSLIANKMGSKGSKQCRRRWKNYLIGDIKSGGWNADEDAQLVEAHRLYGNRWTEIAKHVPGRTDNAVKNRWAALCRKDPSLAEDYGYADTSINTDTHDAEEGWHDGSGYHGGCGDTPHSGSAHINRVALECLGPQLARQLHAIDPTLLTSSILDGAEGALGPPGSPHEDGSASSAYRPTSRMLESPMACHLGPGLITTMMTSNQRDAFYAKQRQLRAMNIAHMGLQNQVDVDVLALHVPRLGTPGSAMGHQHTPFTHCTAYDATPTYAQSLNRSCSSLQGTHHSVTLPQAAAETPCGPVLASRALLSEMALPANVASLEHPSPSLLDIGGQIARDDLCLADDGDLDAEVLEGDAFDLGFDLDLHGPDAGLELGLEGAAVLTQPHHELDATPQAAL